MPVPDFQHLSLISPSCYTDQETEDFLSQFWDKHIHILLEYIFLLSHQKYLTLWSEITIVETKHMAALLTLQQTLLQKRSYLDSSAPVIIIIISQVLGVGFISDFFFFWKQQKTIDLAQLSVFVVMWGQVDRIGAENSWTMEWQTSPGLMVDFSNAELLTNPGTHRPQFQFKRNRCARGTSSAAESIWSPH